MTAADRSSKDMSTNPVNAGSNWILLLILFVVSAVAMGTIVRSMKNTTDSSSATSKNSTSNAPKVAIRTSPETAPAGMVLIPGGQFDMGCEDPRQLTSGGREAMRDARPVHRVQLDPFWTDESEVTNEQFAAFVKATKYVTVAEVAPTAAEFPTAPPENLVAGSVVFTPPQEDVPLDSHFRWWNYVPGANWRHPTGPDSNLKGREKYPVVQVAYEDAAAYADWAGKRLPTEAEWEFAARGGLINKPYSWGDDLKPAGNWAANIWQGKFPVSDAGEDGFIGMAPVAQFQPNGYGLYDMAGNVWEWCSDWYRPDYYAELSRQGSVALNPSGPTSSHDPAEPLVKKRVMRGGSFLCTDQYCTRYMVGSRGKGDIMTGTSHLGFRCVKSAK